MYTQLNLCAVIIQSLEMWIGECKIKQHVSEKQFHFLLTNVTGKVGDYTPYEAYMFYTINHLAVYHICIVTLRITEDIYGNISET